MYAATGGPNVTLGGTDFKWGTGHHYSPRCRRPWVQGNGDLPPVQHSLRKQSRGPRRKRAEMGAAYFALTTDHQVSPCLNFLHLRATNTEVCINRLPVCWLVFVETTHDHRIWTV